MGGTIAPEAPPAGFVEIHRWELTSTEDLARLRSSLHHALTGAPVPADRSLDEVPERIVLVASELATNALRHARPPTLVRLLSDGREYVVDVVDHAPEDPPVVVHGRPPGGGGYGLLLAQRICLDVGWYPAPVGRKHVWARFAVPDHGRTTARRARRDP